MKFGWKRTQSAKSGARANALFAGLLESVMLGPSLANAQVEIAPDPFDSPNPESIPQLGRVIRYDGTFSLPYSVLCDRKKLTRGKYFISSRFEGTLGQATLNQGRHAIEIPAVVQTEA